MQETCPKCDSYLIPYLKTGELKEVIDTLLTSYQLYFCNVCKIVYYEKHEDYKFIDLIGAKKERKVKDELLKKAKEKKDGNTNNESK